MERDIVRYKGQCDFTDYHGYPEGDYGLCTILLRKAQRHHVAHLEEEGTRKYSYKRRLNNN